MSAGQPASQAGIGQTVVPYSTFQEAFQKDPAQVHDGLVQAATAAAAGGDPALQQQMLADWHTAVSELSDSAKPVMKMGADGASILHTPQNDMASRLQSLLLNRATAAGQVGSLQPAQVVKTPEGDSFAPSVLFVKFDDADLIGWLGMAPELDLQADEGGVDRSVNRSGDHSGRCADCGVRDWGPPIRACHRLDHCQPDRCDVVFHVGDTYYSGEANEIHSRLVSDWPKRPAGTLKRSLNGNHEMYSRGGGYFQALRDFFQQPASCFAMQNANWILVGLDTAYVDFDLDEKQVAWLTGIVNAAGTRKLILFSHHQPFSQLDDQGPKLQVALADLLKQQRIHAWYWGHEHRLVIYDPHPLWGFKGRCIGHGGFPGFATMFQG